MCVIPILCLPPLKRCDLAHGSGRLAGGMAVQELGCLSLFIGGSGGWLAFGSEVQSWAVCCAEAPGGQVGL
jgi:hypothetical protein